MRRIFSCPYPAMTPKPVAFGLKWVLLGVLATLFLSGVCFAADATVAKGPLLKLSIADAVKLAMANNESGAIAREEITKAKGLVMESSSAAWPHLTGIVGYKYNIEEPTQEMDFGAAFNPLMASLGLPPMEPVEIPVVYRHNWNFTLNVTQNIYTFGRLGSAIKLAKQYEDISKKGAELADQDIVISVHEAYYQMLLAIELAKLANNNYLLSQKQFDQVKAKYDAGIKSEFELLRAQAELAQAKPVVIEMESAKRVSKINLLRVMGLSLDYQLEPTDGFIEGFPDQPLDELLDTARTMRKELWLLNKQAEMNHTTSKIYVSNMLPVLAADMNYTYTGQSITDNTEFWPQDNDLDWMTFWSVGVTFTWPLFDGLESVGKVRQYRAEERITRLKARQAAKGIELEVTQLADQLKTYREQIVSAKESEAVAQKAFDLASIRYDAGLGTLLEKAEAKAIWTQARFGVAQTLYNLNLTYAKLVRATGKEEN